MRTYGTLEFEQTDPLVRDSVISPSAADQPAVTVICAWCRTVMRVIPVSIHDSCSGQESHSICARCQKEFFPAIP